MCRCSEYTYAVVVETVYCQLFIYLPPMPRAWRRRLARWITNKLVPADVAGDPCQDGTGTLTQEG